MDSGSKARMIRLWRTGSPREGTGMAEGGWGKGEDEGCQRSLCGPERGVGNHLRVSAGIRFYASEGGAGNHLWVSTGIRFYARRAEREIICGIRFYAKAGNHPGIHGRGASSLGV